MKVLLRIPGRALSWRAPVAAIGIFDGVHRGHQAILRRAARRARAIRGTAVAVTFYPHPAVVLAPKSVPPNILSLGQRVQAFGESGIRAAVVIPFTRSFSRWTPDDFVEKLLVGRLRVREVVVGHDFGFGADRKGTVETLRSAGSRYGFRVHVVPPVRSGAQRISSRRIRELIRSGRLADAASFLGRPVAVTARVVSGEGRGKKLGFPTANLRVEAGVLPPVGVYAVRGRIGRANRWHAGMANLGYRPTFGKSTRKQVPPLLEVHFFGLRRSLYGRSAEVRFLKRLRPERKFSAVESLQRQLVQDARHARRLLLHR